MLRSVVRPLFTPLNRARLCQRQPRVGHIGRAGLGLALLLAVALPGWAEEAADAPPRVLDERLELVSLCEQPDLVTPTGVDVDAWGRAWVLESNTHFPPEGYQRHPSDRLYVFVDADGDGQNEQQVTFADGFTHAMSVVVLPVWADPDWKDPAAVATTVARKPVTVYVASRSKIERFQDRDGDLVPEVRETIIRLDTTGNYPHNGLAGLMFNYLPTEAGQEPQLYFGCGENLGAPYALIGSDGSKYDGHGEGGNLFRAELDGSRVARVATGFWNPYANCLDGDGNLFDVDNDPDSRPPCRLLHVVEGGDYGYRFRNGRKGTHPFTSWNGEIPGTLPMISGTGEAPSGLVWYDRMALDRCQHTLIATSWGDHRLDVFRLEPMGWSYRSKFEPLVQGGENFRPVGLAIDTDGSLVFTDWVRKDYEIHSHGRLWRLRSRDQGLHKRPDWDSLAKATNPNDPDLQRMGVLGRLLWQRWNSAPRSQAATTRALIERRPAPEPIPEGAVASFDPFEFAAEVQRLGETLGNDAQAEQQLAEVMAGRATPLPARKSTFLQDEAAIVLATRATHPKAAAVARRALQSRDPMIRFLAVQWIAEEGFSDLRPQVELVMTSEPMTSRLFEGCLACLQMLDGHPASDFEKTPPVESLVAIVLEPGASTTLRARALAFVPPGEPRLSDELLQQLWDTDDATMQRQILQRLIAAPRASLAPWLVGLLERPMKHPGLRYEQLSALGALASDPVAGPLVIPALAELAEQGFAPIPGEAARELRRVLVNPAALPGDWGPRLQQAATQTKDPRLKAALELGLHPTAATDPTVEELLAPPDVEREGGWRPSAEAGERIFFSAQGPACGRCHLVNGRGGRVGPDLSGIARTMDRRKLVESILEPSREVSPQYATYLLEDDDGKSYTGLILGHTTTSAGLLLLGLATGEVIEIDERTIVSHKLTTNSLMPTGLGRLMTRAEFRDLLAYLETLK